MADKIFDDYHGPSIKINGVCYKYIGETTSSKNAEPSEIGGTYDFCLECALESSSSSSSDGPTPILSDGDKIYSLWQENPSYSGPLIEVERTSDTSSQDFYADGTGHVDIDAIETFCSGTNGVVITWYDQSVNGKDLTRNGSGTASTICESGVVNKDPWGYAFIKVNASTSALVNTDTTVVGTTYTYATRAIRQNGSQANYIIDNAPSTGNYCNVQSNSFGSWSWNLYDGGAGGIGTARALSEGSALCMGLFNGSSSKIQMFGIDTENISLASTSTTAGSSMGRHQGGTSGPAWVQTVIGWAEDKSADFDAIAVDQASRYLLDDLSDEFPGTSLTDQKYNEPNDEVTLWNVSGGKIVINDTGLSSRYTSFQLKNANPAFDFNDYSFEVDYSNVSLPNASGNYDQINLYLVNTSNMIISILANTGGNHWIRVVNSSGTQVVSSFETAKTTYSLKIIKDGFHIQYIVDDVVRYSETISTTKQTLAPRFGVRLNGGGGLTADIERITISTDLDERE